MIRWAIILILMSAVIFTVFEKMHSSQTQPKPGVYSVPKDLIYYFKNLHGPTEKTVLPKQIPTSYEKYQQGQDSRLAILLTNSDSNWLALAQGLNTIGVPFIITRDYQRALQHKVIFVYPELSSETLSPEAIQALTKFPKNSGTLIAQAVATGPMSQTFGFKKSLLQRSHTMVYLNPKFAVTTDFTDPEEQAIKIAGKIIQVADLYTYENPTETPLATYEDGSAAIVQKSFAHGKSYVFGLDIGQLIRLGYSNRQTDISKYYVNHFMPTIDVFLRVLKNIYLEGQPNGVTLATVPFAKHLTVIITHDLCLAHGPKNAVTYADFEFTHGIKATYFAQTKYIADGMDSAFFNLDAVEDLKKLNDMNMEIGSHSVSHWKNFNHSPLGNEQEEYPTYTPYVENNATAYRTTVLGELRVSRFLLQHFLPQQNIVSFRPGYLQDSYLLPQSLMATGFSYSSSVTANDSLTHLPFQLTYGRDSLAEVPVYEFPITIEDRADPPMLNRLPQALDIAKKLRRYDGLFVILIHPDIFGQKMQFEQQFVQQVGDVWYDTIGEYGAWWNARNAVELDVIDDVAMQKVQIHAPIAISGLTLNIPKNFQYISSQPIGLKITEDGQKIIIDKMQGQVTLLFKK